MLDGLQEILYTLRQNKLRTLLTAFGVFWGIFMLILLLGFGRGLQHGVMENFGSDVLDFIVLGSGDTSVPYHGMGVGRHIQLDERDVQAISEQIRGVRLISAERSLGTGTITYAGKNSNADIRGIP
ncbi:MAG TPA: ABC transporter permease, partial [Steroidobacteraceae bacterium]